VQGGVYIQRGRETDQPSFGRGRQKKSRKVWAEPRKDTRQGSLPAQGKRGVEETSPKRKHAQREKNLLEGENRNFRNGRKTGKNHPHFEKAMQECRRGTLGEKREEWLSQKEECVERREKSRAYRLKVKAWKYPKKKKTPKE